MPVDDRSRLDLHRKLEAVLGKEEADHLMSHLPPVTWNQVATKDDVATLGTSLRTEMRSMGTELRTEMHAMGTELRSEMHALETRLSTADAELRTEMRLGFAELRGEMQALRADFVEGTNRQIKWLVTFAAAWSSLLVTAVRLIP
jgi:hypothetical protein